MMGHLNSFSASGGGNLNKNFPKIQMPGGLPGGDVEASISLVHNTVEAGQIWGNWGQTFPCFLSWSPQ